VFLRVQPIIAAKPVPNNWIIKRPTCIFIGIFSPFYCFFCLPIVYHTAARQNSTKAILKLDQWYPQTWSGACKHNDYLSHCVWTHKEDWSSRIAPHAHTITFFLRRDWYPQQQHALMLRWQRRPTCAFPSNFHFDLNGTLCKFFVCPTVYPTTSCSHVMCVCFLQSMTKFKCLPKTTWTGQRKQGLTPNEVLLII